MHYRLSDSRSSASHLSSTTTTTTLTTTTDNHLIKALSPSTLSPEHHNHLLLSTTSSHQDERLKVESSLEKKFPEMDSQTSRGSSRMRRGIMTGLIMATNQVHKLHLVSLTVTSSSFLCVLFVSCSSI